MNRFCYLIVFFLLVGFAKGQIINIPDANFKAVLLEASPSVQIAKNLSGNYFKIDANNDGEIQQTEAMQVGSLYLIYQDNISSLAGINNFLNLTYLDCSNNPLITLDLSGLINLNELRCISSYLTQLNVEDLVNLTILRCNQNSLTTLDVSSLTNLLALNCDSNLLTNLDLSTLSNLGALMCGGNNLITLNIKNGSNEGIFLDFSGNPNLQYICADESQMATIQAALSQGSFPYCTANSYCSFTPGGLFYTMQGNNRFDSNGNGCDSSDSNYPNLKLLITNGITSGVLFPNASGSYSLPVQSGTHTLTPILENPSYFNITPTTASVSFPTQNSPFNQNFCIIANGIHNDLDVLILPITIARPGFDASYKIVYKNKGNTIQSGVVNVIFDDNVLDLISSSIVPTNISTGNLTWNFTNLIPFESREITVTLNVNSPTEIPSVIAGDFLNYSAMITNTSDETPLDNNATLNQITINSFDPNDKTCLEGNIVSPAMIGEYVNYIIRFENTGTSFAENIVVKDIIDITKFDIATLSPTSGSHNFYTRISNGNTAEFIFENINLPFVNNANDGYVAFKIKTKSNLVPGDTFSNVASIYFDYNAPIITNTATTSIQTLSIEDFEFDNYLKIWPNPTKDFITISSMQNIEISSFNIYNSLGQLIQVSTHPNEILDVSKLEDGTYFLKIISNKGTSSTKFIKN